MKNTEIDLNELLNFVQDIAYEAGDILLRYQKKRQHLQVFDKGDGKGIASDADQESEEFILSKLKGRFKDHHYLSEESDLEEYKNNIDELNQKKYLWVIDPLDGTNNFVNGIPIFAISIAFLMKGETKLGLVYNPHSGECFFALEGQGASLIDYRINPLKRFRLTVSEKEKAMGECIFSPAPTYDNSLKFEQQLSTFKKNIIGARAVRRLGSAALELCYVACGNFDAYWEKNLQPWDVAAAYLICVEAGAKVTDFSGHVYSPFNESVIAASSSIHSRILGQLES